MKKETSSQHTASAEVVKKATAFFKQTTTSSVFITESCNLFTVEQKVKAFAFAQKNKTYLYLATNKGGEVSLQLQSPIPIPTL